MTETETFRPNWASPPGDTIADVLEDQHDSVWIRSHSEEVRG